MWQIPFQQFCNTVVASLIHQQYRMTSWSYKDDDLVGAHNPQLVAHFLIIYRENGHCLLICSSRSAQPSDRMKVSRTRSAEYPFFDSLRKRFDPRLLLESSTVNLTQRLCLLLPVQNRDSNQTVFALTLLYLGMKKTKKLPVNSGIPKTMIGIPEVNIKCISIYTVILGGDELSFRILGFRGLPISSQWFFSLNSRIYKDEPHRLLRTAGQKRPLDSFLQDIPETPETICNKNL